MYDFQQIRDCGVQNHNAAHTRLSHNYHPILAALTVLVTKATRRLLKNMILHSLLLRTHLILYWIYGLRTFLSSILLFVGNGYIPTSALKEILRELDEGLSEEELDGLIQEIDTDGSGTVDFDGKCPRQI